MKSLLFAILLFPSCATKVYEGGLPVLVTYSNSQYLEFKSPAGSKLKMWGTDNSTPTRVGLDGLTKGGTAILTGMAGTAIPH